MTAYRVEYGNVGFYIQPDMIKTYSDMGYRIFKTVEVEISKVKAQLNLVQKIQDRINKVVDAMNSMEESSNRIIDQSKETIKEGIESIIDLKSLGLS